MNVSSFLAKTATLLAISTGCFISPARAGIIAILRGDDAAPPERQCQRVAFVGPAEVKSVTGSASRLAGIDRWVPLITGEQLRPGDMVRTADGIVLLRMTESQSFVKVTPYTIVRLAACDPHWDRGIVLGAEQSKGFVVRSCRGKAQVRPRNGEWHDVAVNDVIARGAILRTEPGATVDLFDNLANRSVRIAGSAVVNLSPSAFVKNQITSPALAAADVR